MRAGCMITLKTTRPPVSRSTQQVIRFVERVEWNVGGSEGKIVAKQTIVTAVRRNRFPHHNGVREPVRNLSKLDGQGRSAKHPDEGAILNARPASEGGVTGVWIKRPRGGAKIKTHANLSG